MATSEANDFQAATTRPPARFHASASGDGTTGTRGTRDGRGGGAGAGTAGQPIIGGGGAGGGRTGSSGTTGSNTVGGAAGSSTSPRRRVSSYSSRSRWATLASMMPRCRACSRNSINTPRLMPAGVAASPVWMGTVPGTAGPKPSLKSACSSGSAPDTPSRERRRSVSSRRRRPADSVSITPRRNAPAIKPLVKATFSSNFLVNSPASPSA